MISERKTKANRTNARGSTGPRTSTGKARAARNAKQHGLTLPVLADPAWSDDIKALARKIAGEDANADQRELASYVAAGHIDVLRVRQARHQMISQALTDPSYEKPTRAMLRERWLRKEYGWPAPEEAARSSDKDTINTPGKYAKILSDLSAKMVVMDRYERRALSRRKFAIRAFDNARVDAIRKDGS